MRTAPRPIEPPPAPPGYSGGLPRGIALFVGCVAVAAVAAAAMSLADLPAFLSTAPTDFWLLSALAVVSDARPFSLPVTRRRQTTVFLSVCFSYAILLLWGLGPAIATQTVATSAALLRRRSPLTRGIFTISRLALALSAASATLTAVGPEPFVLTAQVDLAELLALVAAAAAWFATNYALIAVGIRLRYGSGWRRVVTRTFGYEVLSTGALLLLAPVLVNAESVWVILLMLVPVFAVSEMARLSSDQDEQIRRDALTGLLSRAALRDEVDDLVAAGTRRRKDGPAGRSFGLLLLDLDHFKDVNDALGHAIGDTVLVEVGHRLTEAVRPEQRVARLGGDEFAVVAAVQDVSAAQAMAAQIAEAFTHPVQVNGLPIDIELSIGVAVWPEHGGDFAALLRHADVAMYEAKHMGDTVAVYSADSDHSSAERLGLLADVRHALVDPARRAEIAVHYQPQVVIANSEVVAAEALLRWWHPERGPVDPEALVRAAEHSPVLQMLTRRVMDDAVRQVASWNRLGLHLRVAVNVGVRDLYSIELADHLAGTLRREGVRPAQVELEITEGALMADPSRVVAAVERLAQLGVALSLDDFGTGYSSLQHLRRLPVAEVKIDRSFVRRMSADPHDDAIVRSTIALAHTMGLRVVAEGVEDDRTRLLLAELRCDIGQGWLYGKPMPAEDFQAWLGGRRVDRVRP
jgi:diguanylate cyclase